MSLLDHALALAERGFHVFPLIEGGKTPAIDAWQKKATTDPERIRKWWLCPVMGTEQPFNIGIHTGAFGADGEALLVLDIDRKNGHDGLKTLQALGLTEGWECPPTLTQRTPTGGLHYIYRVPRPVNHRRAGLLGSGLDARSRGGYIVAAGSVVGDREYVMEGTGAGAAPEPAAAPDWLLDQLGRGGEGPEKAEGAGRVARAVDESDSWAMERARELIAGGEEVVEGERNAAAFLLAARLRDLGLVEGVVLELLGEWNAERVLPPLDEAELEQVVGSCYRSARGAQGGARPDVEFDAAPQETVEDAGTLGPRERLNAEHAFCLVSGSPVVLWETTDAYGRFDLVQMTEQAFHRYYAAFRQRVESQKGARYEAVSKLWMEWDQRRTYKGLTFLPGKDAPAGWYNLWRGYTVQPWEGDASDTPQRWRDAVAAFHEHALHNICQGSRVEYDYLMGFFAHMIQRPWEKPLVSLVFRGGKGTGKNALIDRVAALVKPHALTVANPRYLTSNFNGHMEGLLLLTLDEAFWSGDKKAEGQLKDLITGTESLIERKGREAYTVPNCARVCIIGNEDWLVPASQDERRFVVFSVGDGRKRDARFFREMREGMEAGGYRLLLRELMELDLSGFDIANGPVTAGLIDQQLESLGPVAEWWVDCVREETIHGADFEGWPQTVTCSRLLDAFQRWARQKASGRLRLPNVRQFGRELRQLCPHVERHRSGTGERPWYYVLPNAGIAGKELHRIFRSGAWQDE